MADYRSTKPVVGGVFPVNGGDSAWKRTEPLITAEDLVETYLFGMDLVSGMPDSLTGQRKRMKAPTINKIIDKAVSKAEAETGIIIFPQQIEEKHAWDRNDYDSFGYFMLDHRPVASVESITVNLSTNDDIYVVPPDWIETGNGAWGQLNIIPLTIALTSGNPVAIPTTAGGALLLSIFQGKSQWVASFWKVVYTAGFPDGNVPKIVNELVATIAAQDICSQLAATYGKSQSSSLNIDGMGQSVSTPGPEIFTKRGNDLAAERKLLIGKIKNLYHLKLFSNNV